VVTPANDDSEGAELYRTAFECAAFGMALATPTGRVVKANPAALEVLGYPEDEVCGLKLVDLFAPEDQGALRNAVRTLIVGRSSRYCGEHRIRHRSGDWVWGLVTLAVARNGAGKPSSLVAQIEDVTRRKLAELAVSEREKRYREVVEQLGEGVAIIDLEGRLVFVNRAGHEIFGVKDGTLIGRSLREFTDEQSLALLGHQSGESSRGKAGSYELKIVRPATGAQRNLLVTTTPQHDGDAVVGTFATFRDITEIERVERALQEASTFQQAIIERAAEGLCVCHEIAEFPFVRFTVWNSRMTEMTGYTMDEINRIGWFQTLYPDPEASQRAAARMEQMRDGDDLVAEEWPIRCRDGSERILSISTSVIAVEPEAHHALAMIQDITERKRAEERRERMEEQLRQAQKMEAVGRLAGGVAHDFNNLLQAMLGLTELLKLTPMSSDEAMVRLGEFVELIQRGSRLTRQLLLFSRREAARQETLELNTIVQSAVALMSRLVRENIDIVFEQSSEELPLKGDRGQLEQVVANLALNSADSMPEGGRLVIRTGHSRAGEVWLEVEDTGHGIPSAIQEHVFEPFFTTKEPGKGTGLGLAVVHGIVAQHGGRIDLESEETKGTIIRVALPSIEAAGELAEQPESIPSLAGGSENIVVIEDDPSVRASIEEILSTLGYNVTSVEGCEQASILPVELNADLLIADLVLADGSGTKIAESLSQRWPGLKVIIMSGYVEEDVVGRGFMRRGEHFLQKPFTVQTLDRTVREVLASD
jgi:two-component system cell cycle sensor histidine kinase/response regulator CckA